MQIFIPSAAEEAEILKMLLLNTTHISEAQQLDSDRKQKEKERRSLGPLFFQCARQVYRKRTSTGFEGAGKNDISFIVHPS